MNQRTMRQPRKDVLRDQLALAADEIIRLRTVLEWRGRYDNGFTRDAFQKAFQEPWYRRVQQAINRLPAETQFYLAGVLIGMGVIVPSVVILAILQYSTGSL